jgi:hypothetical protein
MDLVSFTKETVPVTRRGPAFISFSRKAASSISKTAAVMMDMEAGSLIGIHQDKDEPENWYVSLAEDGFELRTNSSGQCIIFNNAALANMLLDYLEIPGERVTFLIGKEPVEEDGVKYWPILTAKPFKNSGDKKWGAKA